MDLEQHRAMTAPAPIIGGAPTFGYPKAFDIVCKVAQISEDPSKRKTFASRMREAQRLGILPGTNTSRGKVATYSIQHLAEMVLIADLIDSHLMGAALVDLLKPNPVHLGAGWDKIFVEGVLQGQGCWMAVNLSGLSYLRNPSDMGVVDSPSWTLVTGRNYTFVTGGSCNSNHTQVILNVAANLRSVLAASGIEPHDLHARMSTRA